MTDFSRRVYIGKNGEEYRMTVSTFKDIQYFHLRKYYQDMEGEFHPTKDGASFPVTMHNTWNLFFALSELLSTAEVEDGTFDLSNIIKEYEQANSTTVPRETVEKLLRRDSGDT